jgi:hypothetical protein
MAALTIQPDATAGLDNTLDLGAATTNRGTATFFAVGSGTTGTPNYRGVIKFDLSSIPAGAVITAATFSLYCYQTLTDTIACYINRILSGNSDWSESQSTWNVRKTGTNWAGSAGCSTAGTDYASENMYSGNPSNSVGWKDFPLDLTEFGLMQANNYGFILYSTTVAGGGAQNPYRFCYSSDYTTDTTKRPKLTIAWRSLFPRRRR